ncbi:MAG: leucine-rich repeat domain-containing protein, partial [Promethearchaeota archaeon]
MVEKEFEVNEYITLKLEDGMINIYVNGEEFRQCKFLLLEVPVEEITSLEDIESIDEASERLNRSMEGNEENERVIPIDAEFWGHCSNLQAWAECDYDTRLLHRDLAFPLLKELTEAGDPLAEKVFKDEIAKRISTGYYPVVHYLLEEGYLDYLSEEETDMLYSGFEIVKFKKKKIPVINSILNLNNRSMKNLSKIKGFNTLSALKDLYLHDNKLKKLPESIRNLKSLRKLNLSNNRLKSLPEAIGHLVTLHRLYLDVNQLESLP